ncbi:hypothetical protein AB0F17_08195 [Nonomuraea sp. NPDC026600]|uniref:hypothetical protein n=1 Tax=Nonomuraea sp. NPDC026600 TaxID=3155363 RepID=UPI0033D3FF12
MRARIDPNVRVRGDNTYTGFEDVEGEAADLHLGEVVTVYEPESGLRGFGSVVDVDLDRRLVFLAVDWSSLRPEEAWAEWDAQVAEIRAGAEERLKTQREEGHGPDARP